MTLERKIPQELQKLSVCHVFEKKKGFINPVMVTFQNGELNERHAGRCSVSFHANDNGETNVEIQTPSGHVFKDANLSENPRPRQIIAVKNKKTNKVRLIEVDHGILINSKLLSQSEKDVAPEKSVTEKAFKTLNQTFGGKKIVNRLREKEKLNLSSLPIADDVKKEVADLKIKGNLLLKDTESDSAMELLPPCNRDTKTISEVYKINEILSEAELDILKAEVSKEEEYFNSKEFSAFILSCYSEIKDSQKDLVQLAGLLFVETLIKFSKIPPKKLNSKTLNLCPFSSVIQEKILTQFCNKTDTSVTRPLAMKDKTLCYIIVLSLICCKYRINLKLLASSTSINFSRLIRLAQLVGATPSPQEGFFILKVPLAPLPKIKRGRGPGK